MSADTDVDRVLSESEVLSIARRHVSRATTLTDVDESGRKGRAYFIDADIVLKTHRPVRLRGRMVEEFETNLEKEAFFLQQIDRAGIAQTPRALGWGRAFGVEYVCMTRVPGASLRRQDLPPDRRTNALRDLGGLLARIHSIPQPEMAASGLFPQDGDAGSLHQRLRALLMQIADAVNGLPAGERIQRDAREVANEVLGLLPDDVEPVALHSNPASEHVYVEQTSGRVVGLIDFGDAYISHPAFDLRPWRQREEREAVLAGYREVRRVDEGFMGAMRAAMVLGELANVTRRRRPVAESEVLIEELLRW